MTKYVPPRQGKAGQILDVLVVLILTVGALYIPFKLELAGASKSTTATGTASYEQLNQDATEIERWKALGFAEPGDASHDGKKLDEAGNAYPVSSHYLITARFDYSFDWASLLAMVVLVVGYFVMIVRFSDKEYREVINEKFGDRP